MLNSIKNLINPDVVLNIATGNNELMLKESSAGSKIKKLRITQVPKVRGQIFILDSQGRKRVCIKAEKDTEVQAVLSCIERRLSRIKI